MSSVCRTCEAPILWAETPYGRPMPLDADPHPDGKWTFVAGKAWQAGEEDRRLHRPLRKSHFATCPNASQHRRAR